MLRGSWQVLAEFEKQSAHNIGQGYLGYMCNDYINAVELALFNIATRTPEPAGFITYGSARGQSFQPVPGFPSATYNDYAHHIFTEIQGTHGPGRSLCRGRMRIGCMFLDASIDSTWARSISSSPHALRECFLRGAGPQGKGKLALG